MLLLLFYIGTGAPPVPDAGHSRRKRRRIVPPPIREDEEGLLMVGIL